MLLTFMLTFIILLPTTDNKQIFDNIDKIDKATLLIDLYCFFRYIHSLEWLILKCYVLFVI